MVNHFFKIRPHKVHWFVVGFIQWVMKKHEINLFKLELLKTLFSRFNKVKRMSWEKFGCNVNIFSLLSLFEALL